MYRRLFVTGCLLTLSIATAGAQAAKGATLELRGPGGSRSLSAVDLAALPRHSIKASAHGVTGEFSGVWLTDLLRLVGAPAGDSLRGRALANYIVVDARDGYRVVFSIAEFDAGYTDRVALLADRVDGKMIDSASGPLRLIVPDEKRPARWVRQVTRISVMSAAP